MWPFKKRQPRRSLNLDQALAELQRIGVQTLPGVKAEHLLVSLNGDRTAPIDRIQLLCVLGEEPETGECIRYSDDIWHFDAECIADHGDYVRLAERFIALTKGELLLSELRDYVDIESGEAWLEFTIQRQRKRWDLTVDDDWMDPSLYMKFQELLHSVGSPRKFMICALGQDALVLCGDDRLRRAISQFTGLTFEWW